MTPRLGPSSYVILGILAAAGPQTPYAMKRIVRDTIAFFWPFPHAQLYAETARLAGLGLLVETREEAGRRRRVYAVTAEGRDALGHWLEAPTPEAAQHRDLGLLKLAFGSVATPDARRRLCVDQLQAHRDRLDLYERYGTMPMDRSLRATLELGLRYERAAVDFWQGLHAELVGESEPSA